MMKRILAAVLALGLVFALGAAQAVCINCSYDVNGFCEVCGQEQPALSVNKVFQITNAGNLLWFMKNVNGGFTNERNAVLTADIVFNPGTFDAQGSYVPKNAEEPRLWRGIGNQTNPYKATFDGSGHTVNVGNVGTTGGSVGALVGKLASGSAIKNSYYQKSASMQHAVGSQVNPSNRGTAGYEASVFKSGQVAYQLNGKKEHGRSGLVSDHRNRRISRIQRGDGLFPVGRKPGIHEWHEISSDRQWRKRQLCCRRLSCHCSRHARDRHAVRQMDRHGWTRLHHRIGQ